MSRPPSAPTRAPLRAPSCKQQAAASLSAPGRAAATMADGIKTNDLQALAFHMFTRCKAERAAFDECLESADKSSKCAEQYKALTACATTL